MCRPWRTSSSPRRRAGGSWWRRRFSTKRMHGWRRGDVRSLSPCRWWSSTPWACPGGFSVRRSCHPLASLRSTRPRVPPSPPLMFPWASPIWNRQITAGCRYTRLWRRTAQWSSRGTRPRMTWWSGCSAQGKECRGKWERQQPRCSLCRSPD